MWESLRILKKKEINKEDIKKVESTINWVAEKMYASGILAEQLHSSTGRSLSATPLVWSHSVYVELILAYLKKKQELESGSVGDLFIPKEL